jgi:hypothetical protein
MSCSGVNINLVQGIDFVSTLTVRSSNGAPVNLSGYTITGGLKRYISSGDIAAFDINILSPTSSGALTFGLFKETTQALPVNQYLYYIEAFPPVGNNSRLSFGYANLNPLP